MRVGLLSDTHGLVRPEALAELAGASLILHAGDVGSARVLRALEPLAEVVAVRGNVDRDGEVAQLPERRLLTLAGWRILLVHRRQDVGETQADVVVFGHSHKPLVERDGPLWVNPGSAGPRRFSLPVGVGWLDLRGEQPVASLVTLAVPPPRKRVRRARS